MLGSMAHARPLCALLILLVPLLGGCSAIGQYGPTPVPSAIVFDQATDSFSVEVDMVKGVKHPIYPGVLPIYTLVEGERREGLIPSSRDEVDRDPSITRVGWAPPRSVWYRHGKWSVGRGGGWSARSKLNYRDYTPGEPVPVQMHKRPVQHRDAPDYWVMIAGSSFQGVH